MQSFTSSLSLIIDPSNIAKSLYNAMLNHHRQFIGLKIIDEHNSLQLQLYGPTKDYNIRTNVKSFIMYTTVIFSKIFLNRCGSNLNELY